MHRRRGHFIRRHTGAINALCGHLAEFGLVSASQRAELNHLLMLVEDGGNTVPGEVAELLGMITSEIRGYDQSIAELDKRLKELCKDADVSRRLRAVPGTGKSQTAKLWTYARDERPWAAPRHRPLGHWARTNGASMAHYRFSGDRKGRHPKDHLTRYRGWMHADGYAGFEDLYRSGAIPEVVCMANVRRKFVDIHRSQGSLITEETIDRIAQLYAVEKEARGSPPDRPPELRRSGVTCPPEVPSL